MLNERDFSFPFTLSVRHLALIVPSAVPSLQNRLNELWNERDAMGVWRNRYTLLTLMCFTS